MKKLLEELFARHYQDVYRYLYSLSHNASLSEELASEVFLEVVKSIALFRQESDIRTWIFSIARHRWYRYLRSRQDNVSLEMLPSELLAPGKPLDERCYDKEVVRRILQILNAEPERTQKIIHMRTEGYSFREIGKALGITENSARVIEFRAKAKMRNILKKEGYDYE